MQEIHPTLRRAARERKGEWLMQSWEKELSPLTCWSMLTAHCVTRTSLTQTDVVFTEKEYAMMSHLARHAMANGTKVNTMYASLEQAAKTLWPTGSVEHVAMRHFGPEMMVRYHTGSSALWIAEGCYWRLKKRYKTRLIPLMALPPPGGSSGPSLTTASDSIEPPPTTAQTGSVGSGETGTLPSKPSGDKPGTLPACVVPPVVEQAPPEHGGITPDDADNIANASYSERVLVVQKGEEKIWGVLGQSFDKTKPGDVRPIVGALIAPASALPNVYANTADNVKSAISERYEKKKKECTLTADDLKRIGSVVSKAISNDKTRGLFSKEKIEAWAHTMLDFEMLKSGKWSVERLENSLAEAWSQAVPRIDLKTAVKAEHMPEGKAPRFLIADGDRGQLFSLIVVKCFEDLLCAHMKERTIKKVAKLAMNGDYCAMDRLLDTLGVPARGEKRKASQKTSTIEGDGSAWDTTCNAKVRNAVENPVLTHIMEVLIGYGVVPESWHREAQHLNEKKSLKLLFHTLRENLRVTIDAIRRSGHRGTSCLNWWMNFVMWICALFKAPERFLDPMVRRGEDLTGIMRWWNGVFEGDDSLAATSPPMCDPDKCNDARLTILSRMFVAFWERGGFNMKLVFCTTRATVVGVHVACVDGELTRDYCPELPRAFKNPVSCSASTVKSVKDRDLATYREIAAAASLGRAVAFAGKLPTVSRKYLEYSLQVAKLPSTVTDRDMCFALGSAEGEKVVAKDVIEGVEAANLGVTPQEEMALLDALGLGCTDDELALFQTYPWDISNLGDFDGFAQSLPPKWR